MTGANTILADAATLHALLNVVSREQPDLADIQAQARVTWLLHLAVTLADQLAADVEAHCERGA
jgi:hypothetical protein